MNPANFQLDKGPSDFDIRNRWVTSLVYELPLGKGKPFLNDMGKVGNTVVGGWQLNTISSWQTGVHRSVGSTNLTGISYVTQRADATGLKPLSSFNGINPQDGFGDNNKGLYWFNPTAFSPTLPLKFGTSGRDIITAPSWWNTDLSAFKNFTFREGMAAIPRGGLQRLQHREVLPARYERGEPKLRPVAECGPAARDATGAALHVLIDSGANKSPAGQRWSAGDFGLRRTYVKLQ